MAGNKNVMHFVWERTCEQCNEYGYECNELLYNR